MPNRTALRSGESSRARQPTTALPACLSRTTLNPRPAACLAHLPSDAALEARRRCTSRRTAHTDRAAIFPISADGGSARAIAPNDEMSEIPRFPAAFAGARFPGPRTCTPHFRLSVARAVLVPIPCPRRNATLPVPSELGAQGGFRWRELGSVLVAKSAVTRGDRSCTLE